MHKREFVSSNLHRIKDKIGSGTARRSDDDAGYSKIEDNDVGYAKIEDSPVKDHHGHNDIAASAPCIDSSLRKAHVKRREEFQRLKRDIDGKLTEILTGLPDEAEELRRRIELINESEILFRDLSEKASSLDDSEWEKSDDYSPALANAMKTLENIRLEIIRQGSKMDKFRNSSARSEAGSESFLVELASLSFKQLFRMGLYFYLPLLAAVGFCAVAIIAGALILAKSF
ncbi:MAG: hypothetical protein A2020_14065 [Lentisphaerae bacterium GWF2_45_14]|nr:MAG: hypothetical protein A2020_14065 [Lentisphaerae bacterium GWF2_45_14]